MTAELLFKDKSFKIVGLAHKVYNDLKYGHQERIYQKAFALELESNGFKVKRELPVEVKYNGQTIGKYMLDFLIDDEIVVEFKVGREFIASHYKQTLSYLKSTNHKLALIILFSPEGVLVKRVVN